MAVDTKAKRASAALLYPHAKGVFPDGAVDRYAVAWVYTGPIAEEPEVLAIPTVLDELSEILKTLGWTSEIIPTLNRNSYI